MKFSDTPECRSRLYCLKCRNDQKFRDLMTEKYGEIKCPLGYKLGMKESKFNKKSLDRMSKFKEKQDVSIASRNRSKKAFANLANHINTSDQNLITLIESLYVEVFSSERIVTRCEFCTGQIGTTIQECCGGKETEVDVYGCTFEESTTEKRCKTCDKYTELNLFDKIKQFEVED